MHAVLRSTSKAALCRHVLPVFQSLPRLANAPAFIALHRTSPPKSLSVSTLYRSVRQYSHHTFANVQTTKLTLNRSSPRHRVTSQFSFLQIRFRHRQSYRYFQDHQPWYTQRRNHYIMGGVAGAGALYYVSHLEKVPISGRRRFIDVSEHQEKTMGKQAFNEIMGQYGRQVLPPTHPYSVMVRTVASRIIQAAGMGSMDWEFYVINAPVQNAFVLPGGKVFVFTGILPVVKNEDGLAVVLGHEIAHQVARHSSEKLSWLKVLMLAQFLLSFVFDTSLFFNRMFLELGILLPFSRKMEVEADEIGLMLTAQACYDPREAIGLWQRMGKSEKGGNLEFMSTHPASTTRIEKIHEWLPKAMELRRENNCDHGIEEWGGIRGWLKSW